MICASGAYGPFQSVARDSACLGNRIIPVSSSVCAPCVVPPVSASQVALAATLRSAPVTLPPGTDLAALEAQLEETQQLAILAAIRALVQAAFPSCSVDTSYSLTSLRRLLGSGPSSGIVVSIRKITVTRTCTGIVALCNSHNGIRAAQVVNSSGTSLSLSFVVDFSVDFSGCTSVAVPNATAAVSAVSSAASTSNTSQAALESLASSVSNTTGTNTTGIVVANVAPAPSATPTATPSPSSTASVTATGSVTSTASSSPTPVPACALAPVAAVPAVPATCVGSGFACARSGAQIVAIAALQVRLWVWLGGCVRVVACVVYNAYLKFGGVYISRCPLSWLVCRGVRYQCLVS